MPLTVHQIENELFSLDINTRAQLAEKLILSIDAPSETENLKLWVDEAERRLAGLRAGNAREYPASEVFRSLRNALR
ncbi:addiction module protein [Geobacter argillaceus]|uniref:Putative addiction module component n=1 Tax=Geobacter argillaceus TaxID=345631 RepID=A0A562VIJ7_9BACT|nr:addiction module protein [Geobacter argillaceus]TWJ17547.1 putative addiction module component [Geobacter argillaceus]